MLEITIPGYGTLQLQHLVLDYNGTLARDGMLLPGVTEALQRLAAQLKIHVVTADTFGKARAQLEQIPCQLIILPEADQHEGKRAYVRKLGSDSTVCIGNGRNDRLMLKDAALGIAVVQEEGAAVEAVVAAHVVCQNVLSALALLTNPGRLKATLRS